MLVGHLADIQPVEEFGVSVSVVSPGGAVARPTISESIVIELAGEYVLATLRDVPLTEEGRYRFVMSLADQAPASVDVTVLSANQAVAAQLH